MMSVCFLFLYSIFAESVFIVKKKKKGVTGMVRKGLLQGRREI